MKDQYAVIGNPVSHSLSPRIHARFAQQTDQDMEYERIEAPLDKFALRVKNFFLAGGKGLNVTVPFKQEAYELAESRSAQATLAGAVNTLALDPAGRLHGHNTDGIGLVRDLTQNLGRSLEQTRILILGAGGATRGIVQPLLEQRPASLIIANRTAGKAEELAAVFARLGAVEGCGLDEIPREDYHWVINATASSLQGEVPAISEELIGPQTCCYDLMYGSSAAVFLQWAQGLGAALAVDGLGMLVEQAAESFKLWRGVRPETADVIAEIRQAP